MPTLIALGGIPAVGKTTIVQQFFEQYDSWKLFKFKKVYGHYHPALDLVILGKYSNGEVFSGTDRLSMAVQPDFNELLDKDMPYNVLFEGDRLFNIKTLQKAKTKMSLQVYIVTSNNTTERHIKREDNQSEKFIKGRKTKIENIKKYLGSDYITLINNQEEDIKKNYNIILKHFTQR